MPLCHKKMRYAAAVGDLAVGITPAPRAGPARDSGPQSRWPPVYHDAINAAGGRRRVVWMAVVSGVVSEELYHANRIYGPRTTCLYKRGAAGLVLRACPSSRV